ncbi:hypothetical protein Tco_0163773 [Tanacetum coccineum]
MADQVVTMAELLVHPPSRILRLEKDKLSMITFDLVSNSLRILYSLKNVKSPEMDIFQLQKSLMISFHEAWDRYKISFVRVLNHGFTELHQLDTFYNALNPVDQDSLNSAAGGNLMERRTQDVLKIIENKSKQTSAVTTAMTAILKLFQATPPPAFIKAVEEICVTCGGAHPYYQCLAADGNTFLEFQNTLQQSWVTTIRLEKFKKTKEANMKAMQNQINNVKNELRNEMQNLIQTSCLKKKTQTTELKNHDAKFLSNGTPSTSGTQGYSLATTVLTRKGELKAITLEVVLFLDGSSVPMPPLFINPEEDECVEETLTDPDLGEFTIKVPPPLVQKAKPTSLKNYVVHKRDPLHP